MSDRIYLRANFSSATTPASGGRLKDAYGHEYASLPLQLPSNLIDNTKKPKSVEMLLTKMNIPIGSIPIAQIGLQRIHRWSANEIEILTNGIMTIWPFLIRPDGIVEGSYENFPVNIPLHSWPIHPMVFPLQSFLSDKSAVNQRLRLVEYTKKLNFFNIEDVMEFLTTNLNDEYNYLFATSGGTVDMKFIFAEENSVLKLHAINMGAERVILPFSNQIVDAYGARPYRTEGQIMTYRTNANGVVVGTSSPEIHGFSVVVNKAVRDMFPRLPWREINNDELEPVNYETRSGTQLPDWRTANNGDPYFYVLDTMTCDSKIVDNGILHPPTLPSQGDMMHVKGIDYTFDGCNLISIVPIQCFVVLMNGVAMTQQTFPVNVQSSSMSSALTTSIPIVEVYYPVWQKISDLSTNLIVSKDAFSNAAPFVLDQNALTQRDLKFSVYYIMTDGTMNELTIPPNTSLSIQVCYSIRY